MLGKVADASVLGALLFLEPRAEEARLLIGGSDLYEPALLSFELGSVALKKIRRELKPENLIVPQLNAVFDMSITWVNVNAAQVVRLALRTGLTAYDASYLQVARIMDLPLVTFDKQLEEAAKRL